MWRSGRRGNRQRAPRALDPGRCRTTAPDHGPSPPAKVLEKAERRLARRPEGLMTDVSLRFEPPFAYIVLNRPDRRNAITRAMWRALPAVRAAIEAREDVLVVLIEGEGAP